MKERKEEGRRKDRKENRRKKEINLKKYRERSSKRAKETDGEACWQMQRWKWMVREKGSDSAHEVKSAEWSEEPC